MAMQLGERERRRCWEGEVAALKGSDGSDVCQRKRAKGARDKIEIESTCRPNIAEETK